jgi:hypothetical protein
MNGNEQFVLLSSKEVEQDGELESIELTYSDDSFNSFFYVNLNFR